MRSTGKWVLLLILSLTGCASTSVRENHRSQATETKAIKVVGMASASTLRSVDDLLLEVVDVGGGLCVIGVGPNGWAFLIDAGHWQGAHCASAADALIPNTGLALVVVSHNDSDHIGDFPRIVAEREVDTLIWTGRLPDECKQGLRSPCPATYQNFVRALGALAARGTTVISLSKTPLVPGASYILGDIEVQLIAGWHESPWEHELNESEAANAVSIVVRIVYGENSVLIMGDSVGRSLEGPEDACEASEKWIVENSNKVPIGSSVLVASHHGADNGSAGCLIEATKPEAVVFSAGSPHDHPRQSTVDRFLARGLKEKALYRTDRGSDAQSGIDEEGRPITKEWVDPWVERCGDKAGDDNIQVYMLRNGPFLIWYEEIDRCALLR